MTAHAIDVEPSQSATIPRETTAPRPYVPMALCRCGHSKSAHQHYRPGLDCSVCGAGGCRSFRRRIGRGARSVPRQA